VENGGVPTAPPSPTVSAVPRRLRVVTRLAAAGLVAAMTVVAVLLKSSTTGVVAFRTADQVAMIGLGLAMGAGVLLLGRPRVDADADGIRIRNIVAAHELPWSVVDAVRFDRHSPWATLLLGNGDEVAVLGVQASDGERALTAVRGLRALLAAYREAHPVPREDLLYPRE
jgi:hypothetical protein